jgi:hypothetical protein
MGNGQGRNQSEQEEQTRTKKKTKKKKKNLRLCLDKLDVPGAEVKTCDVGFAALGANQHERCNEEKNSTHI